MRMINKLLNKYKIITWKIFIDKMDLNYNNRICHKISMNIQ